MFLDNLFCCQKPQTGSLPRSFRGEEVREYLLFDGFPEDINTEVDITQYQDVKINAVLKYVSQFTSGWSKYEGPEMSAEEEEQSLQIRQDA